MDTFKKAEKKLSSWNFFSDDKYEEAAELFEKAGNLYKINKEWDNAAKSFKKAADCYNKAKSFEMTRCLISAAMCFKKVDLNQALQCFNDAYTYSLEQGQFKDAAKYLKEMAEIYETQLDFKNTCEYYKKAAELFEDENCSNIHCLLKVAYYFAKMEKYSDAIAIYEQIVLKSLDHNAKKFFVKDYLFRALLCKLCLNDLIGVKQMVEKYIDLDSSFTFTNECNVIKKIIECVEDNDTEMFTNTVADFDRLMKLDEWKIHLLLKIKNSLEKVSLC